eukprot:9040-Heterococcus_DN1.PRE.2
MDDACIGHHGVAILSCTQGFRNCDLCACYQSSKQWCTSVQAHGTVDAALLYTCELAEAQTKRTSRVIATLAQSSKAPHVSVSSLHHSNISSMQRTLASADRSVGTQNEFASASRAITELMPSQA